MDLCIAQLFSCALRFFYLCLALSFKVILSGLDIRLIEAHAIDYRYKLVTYDLTISCTQYEKLRRQWTWSHQKHGMVHVQEYKSAFMQVIIKALRIERIPGHCKSPKHCGEGSYSDSPASDWKAMIGVCVGLIGLVIWSMGHPVYKACFIPSYYVHMRDMCRVNNPKVLPNHPPRR